MKNQSSSNTAEGLKSILLGLLFLIGGIITYAYLHAAEINGGGIVLPRLVIFIYML